MIELESTDGDHFRCDEFDFDGRDTRKVWSSCDRSSLEVKRIERPDRVIEFCVRPLVKITGRRYESDFLSADPILGTRGKLFPESEVVRRRDVDRRKREFVYRGSRGTRSDLY